MIKKTGDRCWEEDKQTKMVNKQITINNFVSCLRRQLNQKSQIAQNGIEKRYHREMDHNRK